MDKNSVSFQMYLILLSFIAVGLKSQISIDQVTLYSSNVKGILRFLGLLFFWGGGARGPGGAEGVAYAEAKKKMHTAPRSVQFLTSFISFISKYYPVLHVVKGQLTRVASKNSVKLGEKSTSDF